MQSLISHIFQALLLVVIDYNVATYPALKEISIRESRNNYCATNLNTNGTWDFGKYQINDIAFIELKIHKGLPIPNRLVFLNSPFMQEYYAHKLMERNCDILKMYDLDCNYQNQLRSWAGVYSLLDIRNGK